MRRFYSSKGFTVILVVLISAFLLLAKQLESGKIATGAHDDKIGRGNFEAKQIAHAIEQYEIDFPDAGPPSNTREWINRLEGQPPTKISYLKVDQYPRDAAGRLLDPCGSPWIIESQKSPTPNAQGEFIVRSPICPGSAVGNPRNPMFPRN